ncbi:hypothetical protein WDU94_012999 [Cyamophila willieti]
MCIFSTQYLLLSLILCPNLVTMSTGEHKLYLTGASGLLGRAIFKKFQQEGWNVYGTAFSRVNKDLHKVDITQESELSNSIKEFHPDIIIHTAAERFPDKVDKNPEGAKKLNVEATRHLCNVAKAHNIPVIYISTDYVFDGKAAPYSVDATPNPVNLYGETKLQGEKETLGASADNIVLRVPVLYGPVESLNESAVTVLFSVLKDTNKAAQVSNFERRNPSHVNDIATVCHQLSTARIVKKQAGISGIFHWCGDEVMTKYEMIEHMSDVFTMPMAHVQWVVDIGDKPGVVRPYDTRLDKTRLKALGFGQHTPFKSGIEEACAPFY